MNALLSYGRHKSTVCAKQHEKSMRKSVPSAPFKSWSGVMRQQMLIKQTRFKTGADAYLRPELIATQVERQEASVGVQRVQDGAGILIAEPGVPEVQVGEPAGGESLGYETGAIVIDLRVAQRDAGQDAIVLQGLAEMLHGPRHRIRTA